MALSRRTLLKGAGALPLLAANFPMPALAQSGSASTTPPILFVHGNGDHAALWITHYGAWNRTASRAIGCLRSTSRIPWRATTMGWRSQPLLDRGSTPRICRGGQAAEGEDGRRAGGAGRQLARRQRDPQFHQRRPAMSAMPCCAALPITAFAWEENLGNEFNGRGSFLRGLNEGESEVTSGTAFLTLRSDGLDKYAQADGRFVGKPGMPTNVTTEGPALKGATNLVLGAGRSPRDCLSSTRLPRDLQVHRRP